MFCSMQGLYLYAKPLENRWGIFVRGVNSSSNSNELHTYLTENLVP